MNDEKTGKAEKLLQDLGKSIDELIDKAKNSKGTFKLELDKRIEELKKNKATLEKEIEEFRKEHAGSIDKFEKSIQKAAGDLKKTVENLFSKSKKPDKP
jgi:dsDNA-specific endonuclease/ATPase MutS2